MQVGLERERTMESDRRRPLLNSSRRRRQKRRRAARLSTESVMKSCLFAGHWRPNPCRFKGCCIQQGARQRALRLRRNVCVPHPLPRLNPQSLAVAVTRRWNGQCAGANGERSRSCRIQPWEGDTMNNLGMRPRPLRLRFARPIRDTTRRLQSIDGNS